MGVEPRRVVAVGILPGVEEQADDLRVAVLGREGEGLVPLLRRSGRECPSSFRETTGRGGNWEAQGGSTPEQHFRRREFAMRERRQHGAGRIGSRLAEQIDQRDLRPALPRHPAGGDQPESCIEGGTVGLRAGVEDDPRHLDDVGRQAAMADRVLGGEFEQRRVLEVVAPFEGGLLMDQAGMGFEVSPEPIRIARGRGDRPRGGGQAGAAVVRWAWPGFQSVGNDPQLLRPPPHLVGLSGLLRAEALLQPGIAVGVVAVLLPEAALVFDRSSTPFAHLALFQA